MRINGSTEDQCWIIHRACRPSKSKGSRHCVDLRSRSHRSYTTSNHSTRTGTSNILYLPINNLTNKNRCVSNIIKEHILLIGLIGPRQEYRYFPGSNIQQQLIISMAKCTKCKRLLKTGCPLYYCCNQLQSVCNDCSRQRCPSCNRQKDKKHTRKNKDQPVDEYKQRIFSQMSKQIKSVDLCCCCKKEQKDMFFQSMGKKYYCYKCLLKCYKEHLKLVEQLQKIEKDECSLDIELQGCLANPKEIIAFLQQYCYYCYKQIGQIAFNLDNKCRACIECFDKQQKKPIPKDIKPKKCSACTSVINQSNKKFGKQIDGMLICSECLKVSEMNEQKNQIRKQNKKMEENLNKKLKIRQDSSASVDVDKHSKKQQSKKIEADLKEPLLQKQKLSQNYPIQQNPVLLDKKNVEIIRNQIQPREDKGEGGNQNQIKQPNSPQNKITEQNLKDISHVKKSNVHQQFSIIQKLSINLPFDFQLRVKCSKCNYLLQEDSYFQVYQQNLEKSKALRIIETQQQLVKYSKSLKLFCKSCYIGIKKKEMTRSKK